MPFLLYLSIVYMQFQMTIIKIFYSLDEWIKFIHGWFNLPSSQNRERQDMLKNILSLFCAFIINLHCSLNASSHYIVKKPSNAVILRISSILSLSFITWTSILAFFVRAMALPNFLSLIIGPLYYRKWRFWLESPYHSQS